MAIKRHRRTDKLHICTAVSDDLIVRKPAKDKRVHNPAKVGEGTASLTREQIASIHKAILEPEDSGKRCLIALLACTGMRREEVLGRASKALNMQFRRLFRQNCVVKP